MRLTGETIGAYKPPTLRRKSLISRQVHHGPPVPAWEMKALAPNGPALMARISCYAEICGRFSLTEEARGKLMKEQGDVLVSLRR